MTTARLTLHQWEPTALPQENLDVIRSVVVAAQKDGSTLALFPEYSSALEAGALTAQTATVTRDGEWVSALRDLTAETGVTVVVGALVLPPGAPRPRNTMLAVSGGNIVASAEKLHLYDAFGAQESAVISAGEIGPCELFDWAGMKVGMMACYDLRFPEVARRLVDAGAHALVVPAQWMAGPNKDLHWETLLRARAIENQMWVMGVNQPGPHATGLSQVIDPTGKSVLVLGEDAETASCELDASRVEQTRAENPMGSARRFGVTPKG